MVTALSKQLTGRVSPQAIGQIEIQRLSSDLFEGYRRLCDLTGISSDAMDSLSITGAVAASVLRPIDPSSRVVAQAVTVLNVARKDSAADAARATDNRLGDIEAHNLAEPGDVLVIQGVDGISSMGSISASIGKRQGEVGAIVDGAVRDVDHSRAIGYAVWSRSVSPITGKWRIETAGINVPVTIAGVVVNPGDLVLADEVGVCFVPFSKAADVLTIAQKIAGDEERRQKLIAEGISIPELARQGRQHR
jgi:4-hydroxy-4-methyl-2-oxoglutarate aldolase